MDTPYRFSPTTQAILRRAGWFPERCVDTEAYEALYRKEGFPLLPFMTEFLSSFGGIVVCPPQSPDWPLLEIDPFAAVENVNLVRIKGWEGDGLVPIGLFSDQTMFVMADGIVLGDEGPPPGIIHFGNSLVEVIESLGSNSSLSPS